MKHILIVMVCLLTLLALVLPVGATPPNPLTSPLPTPDQHAYAVRETNPTVIPTVILLPETGSLPCWAWALLIFIAIVLLEIICIAIAYMRKRGGEHDQTRT